MEWVDISLEGLNDWDKGCLKDEMMKDPEARQESILVWMLVGNAERFLKNYPYGEGDYGHS